MLGVLENRTVDICEDFTSLYQRASCDSVFQKALKEMTKALDAKKKLRKAENVKRREQEEQERKLVKNMERLQKSDMA